MKKVKIKMLFKFRKIKDVLKFDKISKSQINDEHNVLIYNYEYMFYPFRFYYYVNWFPDVMYTPITREYISHGFFHLFMQIRKANDRKWDIFEKNTKINMDLDHFFFNWMLKNENMMLEKLISEKDQMKYNCSNCVRNKNINFHNHLVCNLFREVNQLNSSIQQNAFYESNSCLNYTPIKQLKKGIRSNA
jgi:hypothetical protein